MTDRPSELGWGWLGVPVVTLGMGAFAPFLYDGIRTRRMSLWWSAAGYFVVAAVALSIGGGASDSSGRSTAAGFLLIANMIAATAQVMALRRRRGTDETDALVVARRDEKRRRKARRIAARDPRLAIDAGIGRPDLPHHYADGGLVDVNRVSAEVLAQLPGIDAETAARIVSTREQVRAFDSLDDLLTTLDLPPQQLDDAADHLVFIR